MYIGSYFYNSIHNLKENNMVTKKKYTLKIPRPQYDRLGSSFDLDDTYFDKLLPDTDEVIFHVSEEQRKLFANFAKNKKSHRYWICQMFLPKNITQWEVTI
jgi:hypothetical protein